MPRRPQDREEAEELAKTIGDQVRSLRQAHAWSQAYLAERVSISTQACARIERGEALPSLPTLMRLCVELRATPSVMLGVDVAEAGAGARTRQGSPQAERLALQVAELDDVALQTLEPIVTLLWREHRRDR